MEINKSVFESFPVLRTNRLTLREIRPSDATKIFEMRSNGLVNQFIARENMDREEKSVDLVEKTINAFKEGAGLGWAGILRDGNQIIGTCGFNKIDHQNLRAEIGGELATNYWGKGIAMEAVNRIIDFGFNDMKLHSIEAKVFPENRGALHILKSLGFRKEGHFKDRTYFNGRFLDLAVYSLISPT